jgi:hypothetical protein
MVYWMADWTVLTKVVKWDAWKAGRMDDTRAVWKVAKWAD